MDKFLVPLVPTKKKKESENSNETVEKEGDNEAECKTKVDETEHRSLKSVNIDLVKESVNVSNVSPKSAESTSAVEQNPVDKSESGKLNIYYAYSPVYAEICDRNEKVKRRVQNFCTSLVERRYWSFQASLIHDLIKSYQMMDKMNIIKPKPAAKELLMYHHSAEYLQVMETAKEILPDDDKENYECENMYNCEEFGFGFDCPLVKETLGYVQIVAGATLQCAQAVITSPSPALAINWGGGWHHAQSDKASGFCYVNDCVLAALRLREVYARVAYIDLDVHHGDGVQDAFQSSSRVFTYSLHHYSPGYFPGTGDCEEVGIGTSGEYFSCNLPFKEGLSNEQFMNICDRTLPALLDCFKPEALVVQCGVDGLSRDPIGAFNLTPAAFIHALDIIKSWKLPTVLLGGGGYNGGNAARCWTKVTSSLLNVELEDDIPDTTENFLMFGPEYSLEIPAGKIPNLNTTEYINQVCSQIEKNLRKTKSSVEKWILDQEKIREEKKTKTAASAACADASNSKKRKRIWDE